MSESFMLEIHVFSSVFDSFRTVVNRIKLYIYIYIYMDILFYTELVKVNRIKKMYSP